VNRRRTTLLGTLGAAIALAAVVPTRPASARRLPDRDAVTILVQGMPVSVDHATFFEDGSVIALRLRNATYEVTRPRIRIVVFDERLRVKGSVAYCAGLLQPGTRQPVLIPLEVKATTAHDQFVVLVEEVLTPRRTYALREPLPIVLRQAQSAVDLRGSRLTTVETSRAGDIPECPCECADAERQSREGCGDAGPSAFTCTPMLPGCSQGFTCKP
jgi:hypothetical protein